jgi:glycosyltransferase involved in cell wall biosynthesis
VRALGDRKGVEIVGFVEDLEAFLARRRVNVAPLRYGAGVKGKVAAALANGVPTVCTPMAAEGMQLVIGSDVVVGDSPHELAERCIELLTDDRRWQAVSDAGLAYAGRVTSRAAAHQRIRAMLGSIGLPPPLEAPAPAATGAAPGMARA